MSTSDLLKNLHAFYFAKPRGDRPLFRALAKMPCRRLVQIGLGNGRRTVKLLDLASRLSDDKVRFTGIDLFEAGGEGHLSLREAHRRFSNDTTRVQLAPGDPLSALHRLANGLTQTDWLLIGHCVDDEALQRAWFYVPRMLHTDTQVWQESLDDAGEPRWQQIEHVAIEDWAGRQRSARRAA